MMDAFSPLQMEIMEQAAMASSRVQMRARHGLFTMQLSTARELAMTAGIPWFSYWELIAMEVPISAARWLGLTLTASQAENKLKAAIIDTPVHRYQVILLLEAWSQ
jgi:hypothetical protein